MKEIKDLIKELKGEGMSQAQIKRSMKQLGYTEAELQGTGLFKDIKKGLHKVQQGVHSVAQVAQFVPGLSQPITLLDKGLTVADKIARKGKGVSGGCASCANCPCRQGRARVAGQPAARQERQRAANENYADFYSIVMQGSGLSLSGPRGQGLNIP